jgi:hypothetical protein
MRTTNRLSMGRAGCDIAACSDRRRDRSGLIPFDWNFSSPNFSERARRAPSAFINRGDSYISAPGCQGTPTKP